MLQKTLWLQQHTSFFFKFFLRKKIAVVALLKESMIILRGQSMNLQNKIAKIDAYAYINFFFKKNRGGHLPPCPSLPLSLNPNHHWYICFLLYFLHDSINIMRPLVAQQSVFSSTYVCGFSFHQIITSSSYGFKN